MKRKEFLRHVESYILERQMIKKGDRIVLGISGGADSVCLFSVFINFMEKYGLSLLAVHVNHKLRGSDSERDEEFVKELCGKYGVECKCFAVDVREKAVDEKLSVEEAGRILRYGIFEDTAKQWRADKIAVAHHENDQAETVLFNLFRGSSLRGLTGIHPVNGMIIRPLLCVGRKEIEDYLKETGLSYCTDISNYSKEYKRNFIRNEILPLAALGVNAGAVRHTARLAGELLEIQEYMEDASLKAYSECCTKTEDGLSIDISKLTDKPAVIQKNVIITAVSALAGQRKDISFVNVKSLLELLSMENGKRTDLPYNLCALKEYGRVRITKKTEKENVGFTFPIEISGLKELLTKELSYKGSGIFSIKDHDIVEIRLPYDINSDLRNCKKVREENQKCRNYNCLRCYVIEKNENFRNIPKNDYTKWFDCDKISKGVLLRTRKTGDYMEIDSTLHKKKLKEILINEKYPKSRRDIIPLLADGSHIIWILGGRISEAYKVTEHTKRIFVCELILKEEEGG